MTIFTYPDVFNPVDVGGNLRGADMGEANVTIRELMTAVQMALFDGLVFSTRAALYADLAHAENSWALVIGDPTSGYDGLYRKSGASGAGTWSRVGDVPGSGFIKATDAGAGTANAIVATSPAIPATDGAALIALNIFETNTASPVTVAFNGGTALTIKTNSGNNPVVGGLVAGMTVVGVVSGSTFRLLSDQASAAVLAAAEAFANAAAASAVVAAGYAAMLSADKVKFKTVALLIADTTMSYTSGVGLIQVASGDVIGAGAFRYEVAGSGASNHHVTTAGGVKLYVLPADDGTVNIMAWNVDSTGATNDTTKINSALASFPQVRFPAGTFMGNMIANADVTLIGEGRDRTIIQQSGTTGITLTVNADVELYGLTLKCHATNTASKTINHSGSNFVRARDVLFTGVNHSLSGGLTAAGEFHNIETYTTDNGGLGALCHSDLATFWDCKFLGYRGTDVIQAIFNDCHFGQADICTLAVHMPGGGTDNSNNPTGATGAAIFRNPVIRAAGSGLTCGNDCHPTIINPDIVVGGQGLYARSKSTHNVLGGRVISTAGTALSYSKTTLTYGIPNEGESTFEGTYISGGFTGANADLSVPSLSDPYPASIGNVVFTDCVFAHDEDEISPKGSTYYIFKSKKQLYVEPVFFSADGETKKFRFKAMEQFVTVSGVSAAHTGCFLSHLDSVTGLPHPKGMKITLLYSGVSSRFVTFASGLTGDGGRMDFSGGASTLATTQNGLAQLVMWNSGWRQI